MGEDRGLWVSRTLLHRQLTAMPCGLYEVRLIHSGSHRPYPGVRRWTASQLSDPAAVRFLRIRNREGYDVYFRPYADDHNAGYVLLDLDRPLPGVIAALRAQGHEPSVVVQTSPGRLQAWIRVSNEPLSPALATRIAKRLAQLYAADLASADWRHVGRLAGFTNRKPQRCQDGLSPWVRLIDARGCLARGGAALIEHFTAEPPACAPPWSRPAQRHASGWDSHTAPDSTAMRTLYQACLTRLRILERYPSPDWSIADKWVAHELLQTGTPLATVAEVLRLGSPGFPRRHADPEDYLRRTTSCAARQIHSSVFPARTHSLD
jgi:RepB DNA-primase from phage plasmid